MSTPITLADLTPEQLIERAGGEQIHEHLGYIGRLTIKDVFVDFHMTGGSSVGRVSVMSIDADDGRIISWIAYEAEDGPQVGTFKSDKVYLTEFEALKDRWRELDEQQDRIARGIRSVYDRMGELIREGYSR